MKLIEKLIPAVRSAAVYNPEIQVIPACILWPDRDRQWEAIIPRLQAELPELLVFGDYNIDKRTGPAIWLRCLLAGANSDITLPKDRPPIIYLPGVSRQDLRAIESCPDNLKPLAELQYRGVIWSQVNAKDWTILAFLKSDQGGLGLDVSQDNEAKNAMQLALYRLLDEDIELLKGKRLDKDYFNTLLTGGDPVRDLLQWLDNAELFKNCRGENEWKAFVEVCKSQLAFNPQNDGPLTGASRLAIHEGPWKSVWERYCEASKRYPGIPTLIRKCSLPSFDLFADATTCGGWPQWNDEQERSLQKDLIALSSLPPHEARNKLASFEKHHGARRKLVWCDLGEAPLAQAIGHLAILADVTKTSLAAGNKDDLLAGYSTNGWLADEAVIQALAAIDTLQDVEAVTTVIRTIYLPWAEESARHLQKVWQQETISKETQTAASECILFVDGLRFDCAKRLVGMLEQAGFSVTEKTVWSALPSVTGTGKPAIAPPVVAGVVAEEPEPYNFEPLTSAQFKKALTDNGWITLGPKDAVTDAVSPSSATKLWVEFGDIDHEGHDRGSKLARHIGVLLQEIRDRINTLHSVGWSRIRVVTDHGWLLLPGGLPKIELPVALVDSKWGRCASIKPGASSDERLYPWSWNHHHQFALADGISCYKKGEEYAHGGLSLQECLLLELIVQNGTAQTSALEITDIAWKGLRCTVAVDGEFSGLSCDIRSHAGDPASSIAVSVKPFKDNGTVSLVVENEELEGREAVLVVLGTDGTMISETRTIIGGQS